MSVLELNIATGLRAELQTIKNASLSAGAGLAIASFLNLQNRISTLTEELTLEKTKTQNAEAKPIDESKEEEKEQEKEKDKEKNKKKPKKKKIKKIKDLKDKDGNYDIETFKQVGQRIRGKNGYKLKDGWRIEQDDAQHAGHHHQNGGGKWKLFNPNGDRVGTLDEFGKLFRD